METQKTEIREALTAFFKEDAGEVVEFMEFMLYDWYQNHARDYYTIDYINDVVNAVFRVNDLLLKLNDAMEVDHNGKELYNYSKAG